MSFATTSAIIQAGGLGKRLRELAPLLPKPLVEIQGRAVLFRQIDSLKRAGIKQIFILGGYLGEMLRDATLAEFSDGVEVLIETEPLGSGGCLSLLRGRLATRALLIGGDLLFDIDIDRLLKFHKSNRAFITLSAHPNRHPRDSDLIDCNDEGRVKRLLTRPHPADLRYRNLVNAAIAVVEPEILELVDGNTPLNFEHDIVRRAIDLGWPVYAYSTSEYIKDMGTPERWESANRDLIEGRVESRSLSRPQRAIFLDRDGVLNRHVGYITTPSQLELIPGTVEAIKRINDSRFLALVVTNQPQIARGDCSMEDLEAIHRELETQLGDQGAKLDDIFVCPHHPEVGHLGENPAYKIRCSCRKPAPGLILEAAARYRLDLEACFLIGDHPRDISAGKQAGCKTVLLQQEASIGPNASEADYVTESLSAAIDWIFSRSTH